MRTSLIVRLRTSVGGARGSSDRLTKSDVSMSWPTLGSSRLITSLRTSSGMYTTPSSTTTRPVRAEPLSAPRKAVWPDNVNSAVRRGGFYLSDVLISSYLREEGRLAALAGDRAGAIRAFQRYLDLRPDPDPELKPQVDAVRAELARLVGEAGGN